MMSSDLYFTDLVGRKARIIKSSNPGNLGIAGTVCDETMNTVHIKAAGGDKVIPKVGTVFAIQIGDSEVEIIGDAIIFRPEDRLKQHSRIEKNLKRRK